MPRASEQSHRAARHTAAITSLLVLLASYGVSGAQPATAQAEQLFREGKRLMREGNIVAACDAFEGSYAKGPVISTLMNLADCREKNQQYASAWAHFVEVARLARTDPAWANLYKTAQERAAAVEPRLSFLIINVPDEARLDGLTITRNGAPVEPVEWNRDLPVDGGEYRVEGKAPAYEAWSTMVRVENAKDKQSVNVPRFRHALAGPTDTPPHDDRRSSFTGKRKAAIGLWALGAVAVGGGVALELKSRSTYDDARAAPDNDRRQELTDSATQQRNLGMVADAVGAIAVGAGVFLWLSGDPADRSLAIAPLVTTHSTTFAIVGTF